MRRVAAIGLAVFMFLVLPDSARSDQAKSIAEGAVAGALVGIVCSSVALTADDEVEARSLLQRAAEGYELPSGLLGCLELPALHELAPE